MKQKNSILDQRGGRKLAEGCQRQEERLWREHHRQEVELEADGASARIARARITDSRLTRTHLAQFKLVRWDVKRGGLLEIVVFTLEVLIFTPADFWKAWKSVDFSYQYMIRQVLLYKSISILKTSSLIEVYFNTKAWLYIWTQSR